MSITRPSRGRFTTFTSFARPPTSKDSSLLADMAAKIGSAFESRLVSADFIRDRRGKWYFLEAGPGAASGIAHEAVFKVRRRQVAGRADGASRGCGRRTDVMIALPKW
ncbi:MAG: hypothetical protein ACREHD_18280 [Pirellulales bacterium]